MQVRHRSSTPPPADRAPLVAPIHVAPLPDHVAVVRTPGGKHVQFGPIPDAPGALTIAAPPTPGMVRLIALLDPGPIAAQLVIEDLVQRPGLHEDTAKKHIAEVMAVLAPLKLEAAVQSALRKHAHDADLNAVADFMSDDSNDALADQVATLKAMLDDLASRSQGQMPAVKEKKPSEHCEEILAALMPELPEDAPKPLMLKAIKDEFSRKERKKALAWITDPSYAHALRLQSAVDTKLSRICLQRDVLDDAMEALAPSQIAYCDELLVVNPKDISARMLRAQMLMAVGEGARAIADYDVVLRETIEPDAYYARAILRLDAGDIAGGLHDWEVALALKPTSSGMFSGYLHAYIEHGSDVARRGLCALALGELEAAQKACDEAPPSEQATCLRAAIDEHMALQLPAPATLSDLQPTKVSETNIKDIADGVVKRLPYEQALSMRAAMMLRTEVGFDGAADEALIARSFKPVQKHIKRGMRDFFAGSCSATQLGQFDALLHSEAGAVLLRCILPALEGLQQTYDAWLMSLHNGEQLRIEPSPATSQTVLRQMFEALVLTPADEGTCVPANAGGLVGAKADALVASFARSIDADDLPTVLALLDDETVRAFILLYRASLDNAFGRFAWLGVLKSLEGMAQQEMKKSLAALKQNPKDATALLARATAHGILNMPGEALRHFDVLIAVQPSARNYTRRALQFAAFGQFDRALSDANEALKRAPFSSQALCVRANIHVERDAAEAAQRDAARAMILAHTLAEKQQAMLVQQKVLEKFEGDSVSDSDSQSEDGDGEATHAIARRA